MLVKCGGDIIDIKDILGVSTQVLKEHELEAYEKKCNGFYKENSYLYEYRGFSERSIDERVLEKVIRILNTYWREISYYLPKPHEAFLPAEKSSFEAISAYWSKSEYNITPDKYDVSIRWKYHWRVNDPLGGHVGNQEEIISLRKVVYPTLKTIINLPPKTSEDRKQESALSFFNLAVTLITSGKETNFFGENSPDISSEAKSDLENIYNELCAYYTEMDSQESALQKQVERKKKHDDFMLLYLGNTLLTIQTKQKQYEYLEGHCGFNVFEKKQEIEDQIAKYQSQNEARRKQELERQRAEREAKRKADAEAKELRYQAYLADIKKKKSYIEVEIKTDFYNEGLLCQTTLSNSEKLEEFSALQKFCIKYIPSLSERGFRIESLHEKYPDHISGESCNAFRDNWVRISRKYSILSRGANGEEKVNDVLRLYDDRIRILRSYTLEKNEHDFIVISPYGISTIEVKNLYGDYVLTETGMLKCLSSNKVTPKDVAFQSKRHLETLRRKLNACSAFSLNVPLQEIICSAEPNFTIKNDYHYIPVCYYNTVDKVLLPENGKVVLNKKAMDALEKYLLENQREAFKYDVFLPRGEINSRTDFIDSFAEVASGYMVAQNTANK